MLFVCLCKAAFCAEGLISLIGLELSVGIDLISSTRVQGKLYLFLVVLNYVYAIINDHAFICS